MNKASYNSPANSIIKEMQSILPVGWRKVCFCFEMGNKVFSGDFFVFVDNDSSPIRANQISKIYNVSDNEISMFYEKVYKILNPLWTKTQTLGGAFSHYILTFNDTSFDEEFDYKELSENYGFYEFWLSWKNKFVTP